MAEWASPVVQLATAVGAGVISGWLALRLVTREDAHADHSRVLFRFGSAILLGSVVCGYLVGLIGWASALPAHLVLGVVTVPLSAVDMAVRRLPSAIISPATAAGLVLLGVAAVVDQSPGRLARAVLAAALLVVTFTGVAMLGQLGAGDIRLLGLLGLYLGWHGWAAVVAGPLLGFVLAALVTGLRLARRRTTWDAPLPLGPYLLVGTLAALGRISLGV